MPEKFAEANLQHDVDDLTFDYLGFKACETLLSWLHHAIYDDHKPPYESLVRTLDITYGYFAIYLHLHVALPSTGNFEFRRRLLDFTTVFWRWKVRWNDGTSNQEGGKPLYVQALNDEQIPGQGNVTGYPAKMPATRSSQTLLRTIPSFMALSANGLALQEAEDQITETWMRLAAEYILQAIVEQILVFRNDDSSLIRQAFDWGFDESSTAEEGTDSFMINTMFFDPESEGTNPRWQLIRREYMDLLHTPQGKSPLEHAKDLLATHWSSSAFQKRMLAFLNNLHHSISRPFMVEVESGNIELAE